MNKIRLFKKVLISLCSICLLFIGSNVNFVANANGEPASNPEITMVEGAYIRISEPNGLRFVAKLNKDMMDSITTNNELNNDVTVGMFIVPQAYVDDYWIHKEMAVNFYDYCKNVKGKLIDFNFKYDEIVKKADGSAEIRGSIVNIYFNNLNLKFNAVGYVKIKDKYTFTTEDSIPDSLNARSFAEVANKALDDPKLTEPQKVTLNNICDVAFYNEIGVKQVNGKYVFEGTEYANLKDIDVTERKNFRNSDKFIKFENSSIVNKFISTSGANGGDNKSFSYEYSDKKVYGETGAIKVKVKDCHDISLYHSSEIKHSKYYFKKLTTYIYNGTDRNCTVNVGFISKDTELVVNKWTRVDFDMQQFISSYVLPITVKKDEKNMNGEFYISSIAITEYEKEPQVKVDLSTSENVKANVVPGNNAIEYTSSREVKLFSKNSMRISLNADYINFKINLPSQNAENATNFALWVYNGSGATFQTSFESGARTININKTGWTRIEFTLDNLINNKYEINFTAIDLIEKGGNNQPYLYVSSLYVV